MEGYLMAALHLLLLDSVIKQLTQFIFITES